MRVLICCCDLFSQVGGGQTVYRRLIETNPDVHFTYFIEDEAADTPRPANSSTVPYRAFEFPYHFDWDFPELEPPHWFWERFKRASNFAYSAQGLSFDVLEVPDYEHVGSVLRPVFSYFGVPFKKVVLSLHGSVSTTLKMNWVSEAYSDVPLEMLESWQYRAVDVRYAISRSYIDEWKRLAGFEAQYLNPLAFIEFPQPHESTDDAKPSINFIGRPELRKGPDIFIELISSLSPEVFSVAQVIGPPAPFGAADAQSYLKRLSESLRLNVKVLPTMKPDELNRLYRTNSVTILPSRYDTLNLVALESLFAGCPTLIGSGAGVCRLLRDELPQIPFIEINVAAQAQALPQLQVLLSDYRGYRKRLVEGVRAFKRPDGAGKLLKIYESKPEHEPRISSLATRWVSSLFKFYDHRPAPTRAKLENAGKRLLVSMAKGLNSLEPQQARTMTFQDLYKSIHELAEITEDNIVQKLQHVWRIADTMKLDRVRIWRELARLERMHGNDLLAATYQLRIMRSLGGDRFGMLDDTAAILRERGFPYEALAAEAIFGPFAERFTRCQACLDYAALRCKDTKELPFERTEDHRGSLAPRVAVIVSLYNAATKLEHFLDQLSEQTLFAKNALEVILIDSGSPADEYGAFRGFLAKRQLPILYARSCERETIQAAWNRGILAARAPYLTFLGVDEAVVPHALEVLAAELDRDRTLDWVIGNSVVTDVNAQGLKVREVMTYDRSGYDQDLVALETCYLSWVGALYRKDIHARFGYYDPTFGAAGDTEFKGRVLPRLRSKALPELLGIFLNYPEERTTASPKAEIEDLRAWYLHRTPAGVAYAFRGRDPAKLEAQFCRCLSYRKSYVKHQSTDIEYARSVVEYLAQADPQSSVLKHRERMLLLADAYRSLDFVVPLSPFSIPSRVEWVTNAAEATNKGFRSTGLNAEFKIFNDNRYEQHSWPWVSDLKQFRTIEGRLVW